MAKLLYMKHLLLFSFLVFGFSIKAQSLIQSVNSGSIISASSSVSIGEIVVVPVNPNQSSSGIIGILAQTQQPLEVPQLNLSNSISVYPNPTTSGIFFNSSENLVGEKISIFSLSGQLLSNKVVAADNSLDLSELQSGMYFIQFANKNIPSFKIIKH